MFSSVTGIDWLKFCPVCGHGGKGLEVCSQRAHDCAKTARREMLWRIVSVMVHVIAAGLVVVARHCPSGNREIRED